MKQYKLTYEKIIEAKNHEEALLDLEKNLVDYPTEIHDMNDWECKEIQDDTMPLVVLSVDDIYLYGKNESLKKYEVTKKEAREIFDSIDSTDWDCEHSTFWSFIEYEIEKFKENNIDWHRIPRHDGSKLGR